MTVPGEAQQRAALIGEARVAIIGARAATGRHRLPGMLEMADIVEALVERVEAAEREHEDNAAFALVQITDLEARVAELEEAMWKIVQFRGSSADHIPYELNQIARSALAGVPVAEEEK